MARPGGKGGRQRKGASANLAVHAVEVSSPGAPAGPSELPQARERYDPDRKETIRTGKCPTHSRTYTTRFLGVQGDCWAFHCPAGSEAFLNRPPSRPTEVAL